MILSLLRALRDVRTHVILPGVLMIAGAALAYFPTTGGRIICDLGICIQERTSAFGVVRDGLLYAPDEIEGFRIEHFYTGGRQTPEARVMIDLRGSSEPLTTGYFANQRELARIVSVGERFLHDGRAERFVVSLEGSFWIKPLALALLLLGTGLAGWTLRAIPSREFFRL